MKLLAIMKKAIGLLCLLAAGVFMGNVVAHPVSSTAQLVGQSVPAKNDIESVNLDAFTCTPIDGGTDDVSVWVFCKETTSVNTRSFAAPVSDSKRASRMLSVILTAVASQQQLTIGFDPADTSHGSFCTVANCRAINWITARSGLQ